MFKINSITINKNQQSFTKDLISMKMKKRKLSNQLEKLIIML